jgi:hypothetical protein
VCEPNQLLGNLIGGGGLIDLHREDTMVIDCKKSRNYSHNLSDV